MPPFNEWPFSQCVMLLGVTVGGRARASHRSNSFLTNASGRLPWRPVDTVWPTWFRPSADHHAMTIHHRTSSRFLSKSVHHIRLWVRHLSHNAPSAFAFFWYFPSEVEPDHIHGCADSIPLDTNPRRRSVVVLDRSLSQIHAPSCIRGFRHDTVFQVLVNAFRMRDTHLSQIQSP